MSDRDFFRVELGLVCWHAIRDIVIDIRLDGHDIQLIEGRGWISREFRVEGERTAVRAAWRALRRWDEATSQ